MKTLKKLLPMVLVLCLVLSLMAACAKSEDTPAPANTDSSTSETTRPADAAPTADSEENESTAPDESSELPDWKEEDAVDMVFYYFLMNQPDDAGMDRVAEAINKLAMEKLNINVKAKGVQLGEYRTAIPMMIAGGEQLDLFNLLNGPVSYATLMGNNSLQDISELLPVYAPDALELVGDTINAFKDGDAIYGVTNYRNFNANQYVVARKDVLEELGLVDQFYAMTKWSDWEEICQQVLDKTDYYPMGGSKCVIWQAGTSAIWYSDSFDFVTYDTLNEPTNLLRADMDDTTVKFIYEQPETAYTLNMINSWNEKGFIYPETYITDENAQVLLKNGVTFSNVTKSEIGVAENWSSRSGVELLGQMLSDTPVLVTTGQVQMGTLVVPVTAEEPEAAVRFINEIYTNEELLNLIAWGIEGTDYVVNEAGEAAYPNGDSHVSYHNMDYTMGNFFLYLPWEGNGSDYREVCYAENQKAVNSPYLGFQLDGSEYDSYVSALTNVYNEYGPRLNSGLYTEEACEEMIAKMESCGLREYVSGVQEQLDAWLASK